MRGFTSSGADAPACMSKLCPHPLQTATSWPPLGIGVLKQAAQTTPRRMDPGSGLGGLEQGIPWSQVPRSQIPGPMRKGTIRKGPECRCLDWDWGLRTVLWSPGTAADWGGPSWTRRFPSFWNLPLTITSSHAPDPAQFPGAIADCFSPTPKPNTYQDLRSFPLQEVSSLHPVPTAPAPIQAGPPAPTLCSPPCPVCPLCPPDRSF